MVRHIIEDRKKKERSHPHALSDAAQTAEEASSPGLLLTHLQQLILAQLAGRQSLAEPGALGGGSGQ
jgi:ribonuclease BN (tRNA processing enzyme)